MLHLRLLGEPTLVHPDAGALPLWRPDTALLAYLALAPDGRSSRALVAGLLWPEVADASARRSLRQVLFRLRRELGEVVVAEGEELRLDAARVRVDVREMERLLAAGEVERALEAYAGPFLAGFSLAESPAFEQWTDRQRARLEDGAAAACEAWVERSLAAGDWRAALAGAIRWSELAPCSEAAAAKRVSLHAQLGDRGSALAAYERFRARLHEELELAPGAEIEALVDRIRREPAARPLPSPTTGKAPALPPEPPLVGREAELALILARWERARRGVGQLVVVTGEPGIGKTRLARELAGWVALEGATVLQGRAYEVERGVPYAALSGVLRSALHAPGLAGVGAQGMAELGRLLPELAARFRGGLPTAAEDLDSGRLRLLEAMREVLESLAYEAPVALVVDDLPWADEATVVVLHYLWRALGSAPLLVLATARTEELLPGTPAGRMLAAITREGAERVEAVELRPLERGGIARLMELSRPASGAADREAECALLERQTGGNPLFLVEALRADAEGVRSSGPTETVRGVVADRLARLSADERELLRAAAVLGRSFPLPLATAVSGLPQERALEAVEELTRRRLVQEAQLGYDFSHDLLRQMVYAELSTPRRTLLHQRAFERLAPAPGEEPPGLERASALALHASRGGLPREAFGWLLRAAELAERVFAAAEAERFLEQAEELAGTGAERTAVRLRRGDLFRAQSRFGSAALAYRAALPGMAAGTPERLRVRIRLLDAALRSTLLSLADAGPTLADLAAEAAEAGAAFLRDVLMAAARAHLQAGRAAEAEDHALRAAEAAGAADEPAPLVRALLLQAQCMVARGTRAGVLALLERAREVARANGLSRELCDVEIDRATELSRLGRWAGALDGWAEARARAERTGAMGAVAVACVNSADVLLRQGEWDAAERALARAMELSERFDFPHLRVDVLVNQALLAWNRGEACAAVERGRAAAEAASAQGFAAAERLGRALAALGLLDSGREGEAEREIRTLDGGGGAAHPIWADDRELVVLARARALRVAGDAASALRLLEDAAREAPDPYAAALLGLESATLFADAEPERAAEILARVLPVLEGLGARPLLERGRAGHITPT